MNRENWFWDIISQSNLDRNKLKEILSDFDKNEIIEFQQFFVDFAVELQDDPFLDYMEDSEDGVEDISYWVVSKGKEFYFEILNNPEKIPFSVDDFSEQILYGIADEVCLEKYNEVTGIF